jgi:hypothetical protein
MLFNKLLPRETVGGTPDDEDLPDWPAWVIEFYQLEA